MKSVLSAISVGPIRDVSMTSAFVMKKTTRSLQAVCSGKIAAFKGLRKPRKHELSAEDKAENTRISRIRILVEHIISGVKRCRIVHDVFRNTKAHFDDLVMEIACGLHNFRTTLRYNTLE